MRYLSVIGVVISFYLFWGQISYYFQTEQRYTTVFFVLLALVCGYIPAEFIKFLVFRKAIEDFMKTPRKSRFAEYVKKREDELKNMK